METPAERRATPRLVGNTIGPIRLRLQSSGNILQGDVQDVSVKGIGLLVAPELPIESGESLALESGPSGAEPRPELTATVCYGRILQNGKKLLGCRFSRFLRVEDFETLG
jgi:hypothetical protein